MEKHGSSLPPGGLDFYRTLIDQYFKQAQRVRLVSNAGDGTHDIFVDFQGSQSQPTIVLAVSQNQPPGPSVNGNANMFLCSRDQQFGAPTFDASGLISQRMLGTLVGVDGSTLQQWGTMFPNFFPSPLPLVIPLNGFVRFCTTSSTGTPPVAGAIFQVDVTYFNVDLCECA